MVFYSVVLARKILLRTLKNHIFHIPYLSFATMLKKKRKIKKNTTGAQNLFDCAFSQEI